MLNVILIFLNIIFLFIILFLFMIGGKYLKAKLKEFLPFLKGTYNWVITFKKGGPIDIDYVSTKGGSAKTTEEETQLENTTHAFIDKATKSQASIHSYDMKPAYVIAEGCPLNVLVKRMDYEPTIIELEKYKAKIKKIIAKQDIRYSKGLINILINRFKKLNDKLEYLPQAQQLLYLTFKEYDSERNYDLRDLNELLQHIYSGINSLQGLLKDKDKSMINFTDYFSNGNLARIFNKRFQEALTNGRLQMAQEYEDKSKFMKIGSVVGVIVILIFGFLLIKQGNIIEEMNQNMLTQTQKLSEKIDDLNTMQPIPTDIDLDNNPINSNNTENGDAND